VFLPNPIKGLNTLKGNTTNPHLWHVLWPKGGAYLWLIVYDMTPRGAYMGINVHLMWKYICNRLGLVVKGPHVQVWITIYKRSCIHHCDMWIVNYEWHLVIWRGFPYYLRIYCINYLYWSCTPCSHFIHGVYFCYFMIFWAFWSLHLVSKHRS
jgi:hypothetical protein